MNGVDIWRIELGELQTLIIAIIALFIGGWVRKSIPMLSKLDIPNAVVGAAIVAGLVLLGQLYFDVNVVFGSRMRDALLLVFFTSIGLSAKLHALKAGGKPLLILCLVTVGAEPGRRGACDGLGCASGLRCTDRFALVCGRAGHGDGLGKPA
jgi:sodium--glutamate symport carrier gltS